MKTLWLLVVFVHRVMLMIRKTEVLGLLKGKIQCKDKILYLIKKIVIKHWVYFLINGRDILKKERN